MNIVDGRIGFGQKIDNAIIISIFGESLRDCEESKKSFTDNIMPIL